MQKIITLLIFNIFVEICFECFKIYYKFINVLQQLLFDVFIFSKKNKITIFQILDKIDQIFSKLFLILFFDFDFIFVFVAFLSRYKYIVKKLLNSTNFCNFF